MNGGVAIIKHLHTGQLQQGKMGGGERGGVTPPAPIYRLQLDHVQIIFLCI